MILISKSDIEVIQLANLVIKSGARTNAYRKMYQSWQNDRENPDSAFLFAACAWAFIFEEEIAPDRHKYLSHAIEALTDCIRIRNNWWLPRYMHCLAVQAIALSPDGQSVQENTSDKECTELIRQQNDSMHVAPYFICPYLLLAKSYIFQGKVDSAIQVIKEGLNRVSTKAVHYPLNILLQPFGEVINMLRSVGCEDMAEQIKDVGTRVFPHSTSLASF